MNFRPIDSEEVIKEIVIRGKESPITIYGAGNYGYHLKGYLEKIYETNITYFATSFCDVDKQCIDDIEVKNIHNIPENNIIIVAVSEQHQDELKKNLEERNSEVIYLMRNEFFRFIISELNANRLLPLEKMSFEIHITDHCNLNCKGCYHFSPISEQFFIDEKDFEKDIKQMKVICGNKVERITLLGGEPLLHPELSKLICIAREYFNEARIEILTNGLLVKNMSEDFWKNLVENRVTFCCTKYPIDVDYAWIEKKAESMGLSVYYHNDVGAGEKTLIKYPFDLSGKQDNVWNYNHCTRSNKCITLKKGKIYTCPMAAHAEIANSYFDLALDLSRDNYFDIFEDGNFEDLTTFLTKPISFCKYCNIKKIPEQIEWGVSKKEKDEWFD